MSLCLINSFRCPICRGTKVGRITRKDKFFCNNCNLEIEDSEKGVRVYRVEVDGSRVLVKK